MHFTYDTSLTYTHYSTDVLVHVAHLEGGVLGLSEGYPATSLDDDKDHQGEQKESQYDASQEG